MREWLTDIAALACIFLGLAAFTAIFWALSG